MKNNYLNYRDIVFINKRVTKTKYGRFPLLICGVNNEGRSVLFGIAMLSREDEECFNYATLHFKKAVGLDVLPKMIMIERNVSLKAAI
jgi:hypothetical protein